ncbi:zinc finger protein, putative, partial [Plasmodium malariae]
NNNNSNSNNNNNNNSNDYNNVNGNNYNVSSDNNNDNYREGDNSCPINYSGKNENEQERDSNIFPNRLQNVNNMSHPATNESVTRQEINEVPSNVTENLYLRGNNLEDGGILHSNIVNDFLPAENDRPNGTAPMSNNFIEIVSDEDIRNTERQNERISSLNNAVDVLSDNRGNSRRVVSNAEELDYYVLTIRDLRNAQANTNANESEYEIDDVHELNFYQRCFIGKLLGYELKPNLDEYNLNKGIRTILFIFLLLALFSIEFILLYNNLLRIKVLDNQLLLIESNYNNNFLNNFLFQMDEREMNNAMLTNDMVTEEINKGNYMLHNNMCTVMNKLNVPCENILDNHSESNEKKRKEKLIENSIKMFDELKKRKMFIYRVRESILYSCKDIMTKAHNSGNNFIFLFVFSRKHLKATVITVIVTTVVLFIDILNDSYLEQVRLTNFEDFPPNRPKRKKFYIIENKKKNVKKCTLVRVNEHMYHETTEEDSNLGRMESKYNGISNSANDNDDDNNNRDEKKRGIKKNKVFNLKNVFNKKYLNKKSIFKKSSNNNNKKNDNSSNEENTYKSNNNLNNSVLLTLEYCEICDERFKNVVLHPCMHGGFCEICIRSMIFNSLKLKDSFPCCPLCRDVIKNVYKISHEDYQKKVQAVNILTIKAK